MPSITGSFAGRAVSQCSVSVPDQPNHEMQLMQVNGVQKSPDPNWNDSQMSYWGSSDLIELNGMQRGYFTNQHRDGDRDCGTFEGKITTTGAQMAVEGTWKFTGGTGKYEGLTGNGTFKGRMTAPGAFEDTWEGHYQLAEKSRAA